MEPFKARNLVRVGGDDQLAAAPVRNATLGEETIERAPARHAQLRLERPRGIVDSRVNDLAVARAGARADRALALEHDGFAPAERQGSGDGETHHAGADYDRVNLFSRHWRTGVCDTSRSAGWDKPGSHYPSDATDGKSRKTAESACRGLEGA